MVIVNEGHCIKMMLIMSASVTSFSLDAVSVFWLNRADTQQTTLELLFGTLKASYPAKNTIQPNIGLIVLIWLMVFRCHLLRQLIPVLFIVIEGNYWLWSCRYLDCRLPWSQRCLEWNVKSLLNNSRCIVMGCIQDVGIQSWEEVF